MLKNWDEKNYRIYGVSLNGYDCDDITCDVLSNVRCKYFLTDCAQKDRLVKNGDDNIKYIYSLEKNRPLFWRVYRNSFLRETSHKNGDGSYYIETATEKGAVEKKTWFSAAHQWLRAEYFDTKGFNGGEILLSSGCKDGEPVFIKKDTALSRTVTLYRCDYGNDPEILERALMRNVSADVSVFSSEGLEYYAEEDGVKRFADIIEDIKKEIAAERAEEFDTTPFEVASGFNFKPEYFKKGGGSLDIRNAKKYGEPEGKDYSLHYGDNRAGDGAGYEDAYEERYENPYAQSPAGFDNMSVKGISMETIRVPVNGISSEDDGGEDFDVIDLSAPPKKKPEPSEAKEGKGKKSREPENFGGYPYGQFERNEKIPVKSKRFYYDEEAEPEDSFCEESNVAVNPWKSKCDMTLNLGSEVYRYYGETNSRNERNGYGRTEQPNGRTAYEGEYFKDHREGFGVHYYKEDGVSYAGSWKNNKREGMGVGFKSEDGSVLAGKWQNNKPSGVCVKFDRDGNVTYYGKYTDGKREGFSVVFREDGVLEIVKWKNDEKSPLVREIDLSDLI